LVCCQRERAFFVARALDAISANNETPNTYLCKERALANALNLVIRHPETAEIRRVERQTAEPQMRVAGLVGRDGMLDTILCDAIHKANSVATLNNDAFRIGGAARLDIHLDNACRRSTLAHENKNQPQ
jgi:aspartate ammonia-lyase